ncbi:unnamed protein product [Gongylonema pulchrum]|uniref:N-acetyltransferase domain-containing protein n=1 Tax=Gongylonema pulchrum TaxID=637853 RepID=A0A183DAA6_9BILA|nr:unnamed protein product [Gongylonema pulchrum]
MSAFFNSNMFVILPVQHYVEANLCSELSMGFHPTVTEFVDDQWKHRVHREHHNPIVRRLFRQVQHAALLQSLNYTHFKVPTNKVECIAGENDEWTHWIMHFTETELTLPHRTQEPIFFIIGREDDVRRALHIVAHMANGDNLSDGLHLDPFRKRDYAIVIEPNFRGNGIHYTLCLHGHFDESDYLPQKSGNSVSLQKKRISNGH